MNSYGSLEREEVLLDDDIFMEKTEESNSKLRRRGLSLFSTTLFIAGEMAGSGVLALPRAIVNTGSIGLVLLIIFCGNAAYGGQKLGDCWNIIEERYPEYRKSTRNPYSIIALKAWGNFGSKFVSNCIRFTLFGAGTVYLLLSSQIIQQLLSDVIPYGKNFCGLFMVISVCLIIPMWLGSPKEFSIVGVVAISSTVIACILFFTQIVRDLVTKQNDEEKVVHKIHDFHDFFLSFGTVLFAFGGASTFPTIQNDMNDKKQFSKSVIIAFVVILVLYLPITAGGFLAYGEEVQSNITMSLTKSSLVNFGNVLMAIHLIFAFLIVMNPVCQDLEEEFRIPKHFTWRRSLLRSSIVIVMIMVGECVPEFGKILSLVGGSTITLLTFVLPPYFYMKLCSKESDTWEKKYITLHEKVYMWELIGIGIIGGLASTFSAINDIFQYDLKGKSCFL